MINLRCLVLNADYAPIFMLPIQAIAVEDGITRVLNGTCHVVHEYDREIRTPNPNFHMNWPSVIACNTYQNVPKNVKLTAQSLYYRDHAVCCYCNKRLSVKSLTMDHVVPRKLGGKTDWNNVVSACEDCNTRKADHPPTGLWEPKYVKPYTPTYYQLVDEARKFPITVPAIEWMDFLGEWKGRVRVSI